MDENIYEGEWYLGWLILSNLVHGNEAINFTGNKYFGNIENKLPHGKGKSISNRGTFKGEFYKGSPKKGKYIRSDGGIYLGEWKNYTYHGKGKLIDKDGKIFEGLFLNGKFVEDSI